MSLIAKLCGGCQKWGHRPTLLNGACVACKRKEAQIIQEHGTCHMSDELVVLVRLTTLHQRGGDVDELVRLAKQEPPL